MAGLLAIGLLGCDGALKDPEHLETVENVKENTDNFIGERVTLTGEVDTVLSDRAFELEELQWMFDEEVLVLTRTPIRLGEKTLTDDKTVVVRGVVRQLVVADVERELDWDLEPEIEVQWENKPIVVADSISAVESYASWSEQELPQGRVVSVWALYTTDPASNLQGVEMKLDNAEITHLSAGDGFWIGLRGKPHLFAHPAPGKTLPKLPAGAQVDVFGTLKTLPPAEEASQRWSLTDADRQRIRYDHLFLEVHALDSAEPRSADKATQSEDGTTEG